MGSTSRPSPAADAARERSDAFLRNLRAQGLTDEDIADDTATPLTAADLAALKKDESGPWPR